MSLYELFDQFCIDFCQAWQLKASSFAVRQILTVCGIGMMLSIGLNFYNSVFKVLCALVDRIVKKIKARSIKSR